MNRQTAQLKKLAKPSRDEQELFLEDDFRWLAEISDVLSPYWSSRVENQPGKMGPVLVLENGRPQNR